MASSISNVRPMRCGKARSGSPTRSNRGIEICSQMKKPMPLASTSAMSSVTVVDKGTSRGRLSVRPVLPVDEGMEEDVSIEGSALEDRLGSSMEGGLYHSSWMVAYRVKSSP